MASVIKLIGTEQVFTTANLFLSTANSTSTGWLCVRILNISTTALATVNVAYSTGNCTITIAPAGELLLKKPANTLIQANSANLLGTLVAWENN